MTPLLMNVLLQKAALAADMRCGKCELKTLSGRYEEAIVRHLIATFGESTVPVGFCEFGSMRKEGKLIL